jgi:hypothetical protein
VLCDQQVKQCGYGTTSEYVRDFIRKDQQRTRLRDAVARRRVIAVRPAG